MSDTGIPQNPENQKAPLILTKRNNSGQLVPYGSQSVQKRQKIKIRVVKVTKNTDKNVRNKSKDKVVPKVRRLIIYPESVTPEPKESTETGLVPYEDKSAQKRRKTKVRGVKATKNATKNVRNKSKDKTVPKQQETELVPYNKKSQQPVVSKGLSKQTSLPRPQPVGSTKPSSDTDSIYDVPPGDWWYTRSLPSGNDSDSQDNPDQPDDQGQNKRNRRRFRFGLFGALVAGFRGDHPHLRLSNDAPRRRPSLPVHIDRRHYGKSNILRINEV